MQTPLWTRPGITLCSTLTLLATGLGMAADAKAQAANPDRNVGDVFLEEIIVTATKRPGGIDVQDAPIAVTAFGENQLYAMHVRNLSDLGFVMPSVALDDVGTTRGVANFSIRGLGVNSSIPSIDPTVGVFVDGMYLGINSGVVLDRFDLESVEVLRGPQGLLFGRNVTGGAVLLHTTRPTDEFSVNARVAAETGLNSYLSARVSGPLSDTVRGKIAAYHNKDDGWFKNLATGDEFGEANTTLVHAAIDISPNDRFYAILRYAHGDSDGDGPASQNAGLFSADSFDFAIDEPGFYDSSWDQAILEATYDVAFGDGQIVDILGYRSYESRTLGDIDASPFFVFHAGSFTDHDQWSNELRYSGSFDNFYVTTGIYYLQQELGYFEHRMIPPAGLDVTGGGFQDTDSLGIFSQVDVELTDTVTLNLGARYDWEDKDAEIGNITLNRCTLEGSCSTFDLVDSRDWTSFTPKIGIQIMPDTETQMYAFWTKGFRSGGYNLRHTAPLIPNESFDQEELNSFEVGLKKDIADGRIRLNAAAYYNTIDDMQREVNESDPFVGVVQLIRNTSDATITGFDAEIGTVLSDSLFLQASLGYVDGSYDEVRFDISGDGVIDQKDLDLAIPRLAPWTYGAQLTYQREWPIGTVTLQGSGYRRDAAAYTDNNEGFLRAVDMFDVNMSLGLLDEQLTVSVYGKNLKDESTIGGDTQLPDNFPGGVNATFSPLNKGRIWGLELQYRVN